MTRASALLIAVLTLIVTTANAPAESKKTAATKPCTQEEFWANCRKQGTRYCDWWWDKQQRMGGN